MAHPDTDRPTAPPLPPGIPDRPAPDATDWQRVRELDAAHVLHTWSAQAGLAPTPIAAASGCWFWDDRGARYFDLAAQLVNVNLGHNHPDLVAAVREQAGRLAYVAPAYASDVRAELAARIVALAGDHMQRVFFTNGGADANEHAVRMARVHTGRHTVLSAYDSYHGGTDLAMGLTAEPRGRMVPEPPGHVHFFRPHPYRSPFHTPGDPPDQAVECERALAHLEAVVVGQGPDTIAAIVLEAVVGTNGAIPPPPGYLAGVRDLCDRHGIVLVLDEVMVGFGRTGSWFAHHRFGVAPDLVTFAKGVNCGMVPLGGVVLSDAIAATFDDRVYPGGLTYSGHPLACAAALATIEVIERDDVLGHVRDLEPWLGERLAELAAAHPSVGNVRGIGLMWAVDLVRDPATREPLVPLVHGLQPPMTDVVAACRSMGVAPFAHQNRIQFTPPLVATRAELAWAADVVDRALSEADRHVRV